MSANDASAAGLMMLNRLDWADIERQLDTEGHSVLPGLLQDDDMQALIDHAQAGAPQRLDPEARGAGTPGAERASGCGELRILGDRLPAPLQAWRSDCYRHLAVIANRWHARLNLADSFPAELAAYQARNQARNQAAGLRFSRSHLSCLEAGDYMALRRGDDDPRVLPLQVVALLSAPGSDFLGGEFVMTEQRPRMQSRPMVLPLRAGDGAIICCASRPVSGHAGDYRVRLRHAISPVRAGTRLGLELTFHLD